MKLTLVTFFALFVHINYRHLNIGFLSLVKFKKLDENNIFFT
jgi:hypothetical protein